MTDRSVFDPGSGIAGAPVILVLTMKTFTLFALAAIAYAQEPKVALHVSPIEKVVVKPGQTVSVKLSATVDEGYHVNSYKPAEDFLIPLTLGWTPGVFEKATSAYPKPQAVKLRFSEKPVLVFAGTFEIVTRFRVDSKARPGAETVAGKLRFQACNDRECLIPRTINVSIPVEITN